MKRIKQLLMVVVLGLAAVSGSVLAETKGVYIDLSSPDIFKIHRAFAVGTMLRSMHDVDVTVFISLSVTPYVNKDLPVAKMLSLRGQDVHQHMEAFMKAGGKIMVCGMCLGGHGLTMANLLPGVTVGMPGKLILADGVKLLSY
ncbi:MAG: DsrE family protein [Planctomycetaceae bacterium]|nr:DsrE family protein [Planctomycetaceae bacterium]